MQPSDSQTRRTFHRKCRATLACLLLPLVGALPLRCQQPEEKPLPDVVTLMRQVEANERKFESIQREYIFRQSGRFEELDSHGGTKKIDSSESEVFWLNGVPVSRTLIKNGKPLTPDEQKKQSDRIDAEVKKTKQRRDKADAKGKETDARGHDELTVARILELGSFSNARREQVAGRDTLIVDFSGDPHAKTRNQAENLFRELAGTVWVDEQDKVLQRLEGHFDHDFKVGGGLVANVGKGTWFKGSFRKINEEVWLPVSFEANGHLRYLLFFSLNGHGNLTFSDYRKFKATSTILPDFTPVRDSITDPDSEGPPPVAAPPTPPTV
jgi:hypothetical protein